MQRIYNYIIISAYCMFSFLFIQISIKTIPVFLLAIILLCLSIYFDNTATTNIVFCCYAIVGLFVPVLYFFIPILISCPVNKKQFLPVLPAVLGIIINFMPFDIFSNKNIIIWKSDFLSVNNNIFSLLAFIYISLGCIISVCLDWQCRKISLIELQYKHTRDDSAELNFLLQDRNRLLIEKRDYEIHTAMLQERNRIAREIHDHVGHMISRCILLTGMVKTINNDEKCDETLQLLDKELAKTMYTVRNSVHNLHNEALNLEEKINELINDFSFCMAKLYCDIKPDMPSQVKYAFLSITKEALTNVAKHSNATLVRIRIIEHPAIYQLFIADNGSGKQSNISDEKHMGLPGNNGIGLQNIKDRVTALNGTLHISNENGYSIFVSIPK